MKKAKYLILGVFGFLEACASSSAPSPVVATASNTVFTLDTAYVTAVNLEVSVIKSGTIPGPTVQQMKSLDTAAYTALKAVTTDAAKLAPGATLSDAEVLAAQTAITAFQNFLFENPGKK